MLTDFINKVGVNKILHFTFGAIISFVITNIVIIQEGIIDVSVIWASIIGVIVALIVELFKEFIVDNNVDKKDILATVLGSILPIIVNTIGYLFNIWSN